MRNIFLLLFSSLLLLQCKTPEATYYGFPVPIDTNDKVIELQEKKTYQIGNIYADNQFDGARLNDFQLEDSIYVASILPENAPINNSAWYAFKLWSDEVQTIDLLLKYENGKHRYPPKISSDGKNWTNLDTLLWEKIGENAQLQLELSTDTLWLAAQEITTTKDVKNWCLQQAQHSDVRFSSIGQSQLGRDLYLLDIYEGTAIEEKPTIVIFSRQHPPEVTGYFAMEAFVEAILEDRPLSNAFRKKYRVLVFPLLNPDGVDMGHWRHNANGIDLNRDWAFYRQTEIRQIANYVVKAAHEAKSDVILGLDFHSTWSDIYYTNSLPNDHIPNFKDYWLQGIRESYGDPDLDLNEKPSKLGAPVSKGWFYTQFGAEASTYEIGDNTPRDVIVKKGRISAIEMMELLIFRE